MRATYKLGRDVITEFEAQNAGNSISGPNFKTFSGGGGMPGIGMSHGQGMRLDPRLTSHYLLLELHLTRRKFDMRATYKLGRDVITEFEAQNAGNSISGPNFKTFSGGGGCQVLE